MIGCGRRVEPLEEMATAITAAGGSAEFEAMDIRNEDEVDSSWTGCSSAMGGSTSW